jgi:hypothetical protein
MTRRKFTADWRRHMTMEQWSECKSIGECRKFSEGVKTWRREDVKMWRREDVKKWRREYMFDFSWPGWPRTWNSRDPGLLAWAWYTCDGAKISLPVGCIVTNSGDSLAGKLGREIFPFEISSTSVDIQSKATPLEMAKVMAQQLAIHANARFQHPLTGDESWTACNDSPSRMWTITRSDIDQIAWPTNHPRKIIMAIFFGVNSIAFINILFEKIKLNSEYFKENIIKEFDLIVCPAGLKSYTTHIELHFR